MNINFSVNNSNVITTCNIMNRLAPLMIIIFLVTLAVNRGLKLVANLALEFVHKLSATISNHFTNPAKLQSES